MGKGDKKSRRGKITMGTFGVRRPRKRNKPNHVVVVKKTATKPATKAKPAAKKVTAKKAAPKKTTTKKTAVKAEKK